MRIVLVLALAFLLGGCTEEQSRSVGAQPKKTLDRVSGDLDKAMRQGAERLKDGEQ